MATSTKTSFDDEQDVGIAIPATIAVLGGSFVGCALLLSGLPPMAGFIAKFAMLTGMLNAGPSAVANDAIAPSAWVLAALLLLSGLAAADRDDAHGHHDILGADGQLGPPRPADRGDPRRDASLCAASASLSLAARPCATWRRPFGRSRIRGSTRGLS